MILKFCPCCAKLQTTKNAEFIGRFELSRPGLMFNCRNCRGTFVVMAEKAKPVVQKISYEELNELAYMARDVVRRLTK